MAKREQGSSTVNDGFLVSIEMFLAEVGFPYKEGENAHIKFGPVINRLVGRNDNQKTK